MKKSIILLFTLAIYAHCDSQRQESSMFLDYEKAITKESQKKSDNIFTKPVILTKSTDTKSKNTKVTTIDIQEESKPFIDTRSIESNLVINDIINEPKTKKITENLRSIQQKLLTKAKEFLGTPYGFGNKNGGKTDCSGFTQQVYSSFGVNLPRSASEQIAFGEKVELKDLEVGDLLFYKTYKSDPSHVAIYAGDGQIIHASFAAKKVQFDSIDKEYYKNRFIGAKRIALNDTNE